MKQPLMLTQSSLPPAQAEALYETLSDSAAGSRPPAGDAAAWPGEDWDDAGEPASFARVLRSAGPIPHLGQTVMSSARR